MWEEGGVTVCVFSNQTIPEFYMRSLTCIAAGSSLSVNVSVVQSTDTVK